MYQQNISNNPFHPVILEAENRPIRLTRLEVIDNVPGSIGELPTVGVPGGMTLFIGRKGSGALDDVRSAIVHGVKKVPKLLDRFKQFADSKFEAQGQELAQMMLNAPVFADIRYGGEVLNRGVFLPDGVDVVFTVFPYNGGHLDKDGFVLAEHYQPDSRVELEGLIVRVMPPLTLAEQTALARVPADQVNRNVGTSLWCDTTWWRIAIAAAVYTEAAACTIILLASPIKKMSDEEFAKLDPSASARELLKTRRNLLRKDFS